jgi:hypothetical protein
MRAAGSGITSYRAVEGEEAIVYRNILIAVDGSESSKRALLQAIHMGNAGYEKMTAVYVLDRSAMFMYAANYDRFAFVDRLRHDGELVLADAQAVMAEHGGSSVTPKWRKPTTYRRMSRTACCAAHSAMALISWSWALTDGAE